MQSRWKRLMDNIAGWGRYPVIQGFEHVSEDLEAASRDALLVRGLGRSYGDSSLPPHEGQTVINSTRADRLIAFDSDTGILRAEAGFSLFDLNRLFQPRGWTTPVSPGTQFVTLGGMVASDIHGGNHHVNGCFGEHVRALRMRVADGRILEVTEDSEPELFRATLGGMGLTGHILEVEVQLEAIPSAWIWGESEQVHSLEELVVNLRESSSRWPITKSWVDSMKRGPNMGRGIVMRGRWAEPHEAPAKAPAPHTGPTVPVDFPSWVLGPASVSAFNHLYFHKHSRKPKRGVIHPWTVTYPLDAIGSWNRIYGRRGLAQYQCVLPDEDDPNVVRRFFEVLTSSGVASFLTVVKDLGAEGKGMLSFPKRGISIALDIPMHPNKTQAITDALNEVVIAANGRIYLAKDALTRPDHFRAMEPRFEAWNAVRKKWDPDGKIRSAQSVRLFGDDA
jgi:decaprenylphospho-beta-D-ribofuranose 2-oxidase